VPPQPNKKTRELLDTIEKDIKEGKNLSGPFNNARDMLRTLD